MVGALTLVGFLAIPAFLIFKFTRRPGLRALAVAVPLTPLFAYLVFVLVGTLRYGSDSGRGLYPELAVNEAFMKALVAGSFITLFVVTYVWTRRGNARVTSSGSARDLPSV